MLSSGLLVACGDDTSSSICGPDNCPGCCDPNNGLCQAGNHYLSCGTNGNICLACTAGTECNATLGRCEASTQVCTPATCAGGCCTSTGQCQTPGNLNYACGTGGQLCQNCTGSQQCVNGSCSDFNPQACTAQNCATGCCYGDQCQPYPNASQCGLNGSPCQSCPGGYTCNTQTGQCQDPSGCGTPCAQANGCCLNNQCQPGNHPAACGSGGQNCVACAQDQVCRDQSCQSAVNPGDCTPFNCPTGCCDSEGRCHIDGAINEQYCGVLGLQCETCQTWEECSLGSCKPKSVSCSCGPGQCCNGGTCVPGNTTTQCGTNGAPCDNCLTKLPPSTCNTATFICGDSTPSCTNCIAGCCENGNCIPYASQSSSRCGSGGATCQPCSSGSCDLSTGTCSTGTDSYKTCVVSVTFNCASFPDCVDDPDPLLYVSLAVEGEDFYDESTRQSFTVTDINQTLNFNWCGPDSDSLSEIVAGVKLKIWEEDDTWSPFDLLDNTLAECTVQPPQSVVTGGTQWATTCGNISITLRFEP